ncbi:unnamed protein product [Cercospora beticola]|nr:unnamed protein product [Cercospora beticola]
MKLLSFSLFMLFAAQSAYAQLPWTCDMGSGPAAPHGYCWNDPNNRGRGSGYACRKVSKTTMLPSVETGLWS